MELVYVELFHVAGNAYKTDIEMKDFVTQECLCACIAFMLMDILLCLQVDSIDFIMRPISLQECIMKGP